MAASAGAVADLRVQGYRKLDAFSPFPIHGLSKQLGLGRSLLPPVVFVAGALGLLLALGVLSCLAVATRTVTVRVEIVRAGYERARLEEQIEDIHQATLRVLWKTGARIESEWALGFLESHGCRVDRGLLRVRFPADLVEDCLSIHEATGPNVSHSQLHEREQPSPR